MNQREIQSACLILAAFLVALSTLFFGTSCGPDGVVAEPVPATCACAPGDMLITELMINPPGEDDGLEYVEVMNVSDRPVDLEGLVVISGSMARPDVSSVSGWTSPAVQPGERVVISEAPPAAGTSNVSVTSLVLSNAAGTVSLMCSSVEIDVVSWGESPTAPPEGLSLQMAPAADRTAPRVWCASEDPAGPDGSCGSPGTPNHGCRSDAVCFDRETGTNRTLVRPAKDDLAVTEVFANPDGADTLDQEWIEIVALSKFDLGGATVTHFNGDDDQASSRVFQIPAGDCNPVVIGDVVIIGGPDGVPLTGQSTFYNATGGVATVQIADPTGNVVATARHPKVPDGASVSLKKALATGDAAAVADDDPASWVATRCASGVAASPGTLDVVCPRKIP